VSVSRRIGEKDPSRQVKRVPCPRSVEGSRQQGEIRLGEFLSPPEQAHDDKEISIGKKRSFDTAMEYGTVAIIATEKTRTAKSALRATCFRTGQGRKADGLFRGGRFCRA
jgi:hypothetical protein